MQGQLHVRLGEFLSCRPAAPTEGQWQRGAASPRPPARLPPRRPSATEQRCGEVESAAFDVFHLLGATEEQLDFPVLYASAREVGDARDAMGAPLACCRGHCCYAA